MNTWLTPTCQWLGAGNGATSAIICALLVALLLAGIALGFGPLHAWLGMGAAHDRSGIRSVSAEDNLLAMWRLYRQLGRADPPAVGFSVPDVPACIVPGAVGAFEQDEQPTPDPTSTVS